MRPMHTTGIAFNNGPLFRRLSLASVVLGIQLWAGLAVAGPEGGRVVGGEGDIDRDGRTTTVTQSTDRLALDWDSFDVDADETVNYIQPGSDSIALNRILSHRGSEIHGRINANGLVVLVNPHGMLFGDGALVNVGGILASGLRMDADDFMNGDLTFAALDGTDGAVINRGLIQAATGGSVGLLGRQVENEGLISARLGAINLAAGNEAVVTFDDAGLMGVRVSKAVVQDELGVDPAVFNSGDIEAEGGRILLTASASRDLFSQSVNAGSLTHASEVEVHEDGSFTLGGADLVNTGRLDVSSETGVGGDITLLGERVGLAGQAQVDASGATGGGQIRVGGDYKGQNPNLVNSQRTFVGADARLSANATDEGDGGRIIVWADELTRYAGDLEAKGVGRGRGGFAEVSGKEVLEFTGTARLSGPGGAGTLLLDPRDITIDRTSTVELPESGIVNFNDMFTDPEGDVTFSRNSIADLLDGGTDVILEATRDIRVSEGFGTSSDNTNGLTLRAGDDIQVDSGADIDLGTGAIEFTAGIGDCVNTECASDAENLAGDDAVDLSGRSLFVDGELNTDGTVNLRAADNITINKALGKQSNLSSVSLRAGNSIAVANTSPDTAVELTELPSAEILGINPSVNLTLKAGDASLAEEQGGDLAAASDGAGFSQDLTIEGALNTGGGSVLLNAGGAVEVEADITTLGGHFSVGASDVSGDGYRPTGFTHTGGTINTGYGTQTMEVGGTERELTVVGDVEIYTTDTNAGHVVLGAVDLGYESPEVDSDGGAGRTGSIIVDAAGDFTFDSTFEFNNSGPRDGSGNSLDLSSADEVELDVRAGGDITLNAAIYDGFGDQRDALDVTLNAVGAVTLNNILYTSGGNVDITGESVAFGDDGVVDTGRAYNSDDGYRNEGGPESAGWSNGSYVKIITTLGGNLGNITTGSGCSGGICTGNFRLDTNASGSYDLVQNNDTTLDVAGTTTVDVGSGVVTLNEEGNHFEGDWTLTSAGAVSVRDDGDIRFDIGSAVGPISVNTTGAEEQDGGGIIFRPQNANDGNFTLNLGEIIASGGDGDRNDDGGSGGYIDAQAPTIVLNNDLTSRGGDGDDNGYSGAITLTGDVKVTDSVKVDLSPRGDLKSTAPDTGGEYTVGALTVDGALDSIAGGMNDLTVNAIDIEITQAIGAIEALGDVIFDTHGDVTLGGEALPTAVSMAINGQSSDHDHELQGPDSATLWTLTASGNGKLAPDPEGSATGGSVSFTGINTLRAGSQNSRFVLDLSADAINDGGDIEFSLFGGSGTDTLKGGDIENTWRLDTVNGYTLNNELAFEGIENLEGGSGDDAFEMVGDTAFGGEIDGGSGGINTLDFSDYTPSVEVRFGENGPNWNITRINALTGNGDTTLALDSGMNTWTLTGAAEGNVETTPASGDTALFTGIFTFTDVSALTGGSGKDTFEATGSEVFAGPIDGGVNDDSTQNTLDVSGFDGDVNFILGDGSAGWDYSNIQAFMGSSDDTLGITHGTNTWSLNQTDGGELAHSADSNPAIDADIEFSGFGTLRGGSGNDTFTVTGNYSGTVAGYDGQNHIQAETSDNAWVLDQAYGGQLTLGSGGVIGFTNIQELTGGEDNTLTARSSQDNTWSSGVGDEWTLGNSESDRITFRGITSWVGGDQDDTFELGDRRDVASIDGGAAAAENTDAITASNGGIWVLSGSRAGTLDEQTGFSNIASIESSGGDASLKGPDSPTLWQLTDSAAGDVGAPSADEAERLSFTGIDHLMGGTGVDTFNLSDAGRVSRIEGGGGTGENVVNLESLSEALLVSLDVEASEADLRLSAIDEVHATGDAEHSLQADNQPNIWVIDRKYAGSLNSESVTFSGFATLVGNADTDEFRLEGADAEITGSLKGGDGEDTLDLNRFATSSTLATAANDEADLTIIDFEEILAPIDAGHTLISSDAGGEWEITGLNSGKLDDLKFSGVENLRGGDGDDRFEYSPDGELDGFLDGGGREEENTLDFSKVERTTVEFGADGDFSNIDVLRGAREKTTLQGVGENIQWELSQGRNAGTVTTGGQTLRFSHVTDLLGGDRGNYFTIADGWVTGDITGGAQSDEFDVELAPEAQGELDLYGGGGSDNTLRVSGGDGGYLANYSINASDEERLTYTSANKATYTIKFEGLHGVDDDVTADELEAGATLDPDTLNLTDRGYEVDGFTPLSYRNKTHLTVAANNDDQLNIDGALDFPGTLTILGARVSQSSADALIRARHLKLEGVEQVGDESQPLYTGVGQLSAEVGQGGLFIQNEDALTLNALISRGPASLTAAGALASEAALTVDGSLMLTSERAGIRLTGDNRFTGPVSLSAAGDVRLHNTRALTLNDVSARQVTLDVTNSITGLGAVEAERFYLGADGDITFEHEDNALGELSVSRADRITWRNSAALTVGDIGIDGAVSIAAAGMTVDGALSGGSLNLDGRNALLQINESVVARGTEGITLAGGDIELNGALTSAGALSGVSQGHLRQDGNLEVGGDITLSADNGLRMNRNARTRSDGGHIDYEAGGAIVLGRLETQDGEITLNSGGRVDNATSEGTHIVSHRLTIQANSGVGEGARLRTDVDELSLTNQTGPVALTNTGTVRVERLASNGNISLTNNGSVELDGREGSVFRQDDNNAVSAGGTANANYNSGNLSIFINDGDLVALGPHDQDQPDLVAYNGTLVVGGAIGDTSRPLVMAFKNDLFLQAFRSWPPTWGFGDPPRQVDNQSTIQVTMQDLLRAGAEQMVEVEQLEDVNPAIFTEVRNYTYDDVAIMMPESQRYEDDDDQY